MSGVARHWIAVASAEHVALGRAGGFMQVCHGKAAPLRRIAPGDGVIYYSSVARIGGTERVQAFTAIGTVAEGVPYQVETATGFAPWRRDVAWDRAGDAPIRPLLDSLSFVGGAANWGYKFRYGLFEIDAADAASIARQMRREAAA